MTKLRALSLSLAVVTAGVSEPAAAQDKSFSIPPAAIAALNGQSGGSSIDLLKNATSPGFAINFMVPMDHALNTQIVVRVYMLMQSGSPCTAATQLVNVGRRRPGQLAYVTTFPSIDRVVPAGSIEQTDFTAADNTVLVKTYYVRTPLAAPFNGLRPGDNINLRIQRLTADPSDTCTGTLSIWGADVRYTLATPPV